MNQTFTPKAYKFQEQNDQTVTVLEELWKWEATYTDDTSLKQFDDVTGFFHQMKEIDLTKLRSLKIVSSHFSNSFEVSFPQEQFNLIIRHERTRLDIGGQNDTGWFTLFVFGYEISAERKLFLVVCDDQAVITEDYTKLLIS